MQHLLFFLITKTFTIISTYVVHFIHFIVTIFNIINEPIFHASCSNFLLNKNLIFRTWHINFTVKNVIIYIKLSIFNVLKWLKNLCWHIFSSNIYNNYKLFLVIGIQKYNLYVIGILFINFCFTLFNFYAS